MVTAHERSSEPKPDQGAGILSVNDRTFLVWRGTSRAVSCASKGCLKCRNIPVKQPNGKYAVFSTVVDDFVATNATADEIMDFYRQEAIEESDRQSQSGLKRAEQLGAKRFMECLDSIFMVHGHAIAEQRRHDGSKEAEMSEPNNSNLPDTIVSVRG